MPTETYRNVQSLRLYGTKCAALFAWSTWDQTIAEIQKEGGKAGQGKKKKLKHFEVQWAHMIHDRLAT